MRRTTFIAAAASAALSAGLLAGTTPAQADGPGPAPTLDSVYQDSSRPGTVYVIADSTGQISHITVHFFPAGSPEGTAEAGSTEAFTPPSRTDPAHPGWSAQVHLPDLGNYRMTVDLEDSSGATATGLPAPDDFTYQPVLEIPDLTATPTAPDYLHQKVTATGTVVAVDPRQPDTPTPVPGEDVSLPTGLSTLTVRTGADGRFTGSFTPLSTVFELAAWPRPSVAHPGAVLLGTPSRLLHTVQAPTRLTTSVNSLSVRPGSTGTVTGRAEIQLAGVWRPLPRTRLFCLDDSRNAILAEATTDANGDYAMKIYGNLALHGEIVTDTYQRPFQLQATHPLALHLAYPVDLNSDVMLDERSRLHVSGWVDLEAARAHWPAHPAVTVEYSANGRTGWKTASTIPIKLRYTDPRRLELFDHTFTAANTGYWRVRFNGNADLTTAINRPVHLYRYATRIAGFNMTPEPVRKGAYLYPHGTLQYKVGSTWKPLSSPDLSLYFRPRGATSYRYFGDLATDRHGRIAGGWQIAERDGTWAVAFNRHGEDHYLNSPWAFDYVDVR